MPICKVVCTVPKPTPAIILSHQGFQGGFTGYQRGQQMAPYAGQAIGGQAVPNVQMQQQFMMQQQKQQKKMMELQRKQTEVNQKKQEELRRRHNFEMQQRKLQNRQKGGTGHLEVNNLFGKKKSAEAGAAVNLIGSLGMSSKATAKHASGSGICKFYSVFNADVKLHLPQ